MSPPVELFQADAHLIETERLMRIQQEHARDVKEREVLLRRLAAVNQRLADTNPERTDALGDAAQDHSHGDDALPNDFQHCQAKSCASEAQYDGKYGSTR